MKNRCTNKKEKEYGMHSDFKTGNRKKKIIRESRDKLQKREEMKEKMRRGMMEKGKTREGYPQDPLYHILQ